MIWLTPLLSALATIGLIVWIGATMQREASGTVEGVWRDG